MGNFIKEKLMVRVFTSGKMVVHTRESLSTVCVREKDIGNHLMVISSKDSIFRM